MKPIRKFFLKALVFIVFLLVILAIYFVYAFEKDAKATIYVEVRAANCRNEYIQFASYEYLRYEIKNKYNPNLKRNPARTNKSIKRLKEVSLANHIAANTFKSENKDNIIFGDISNLKYVLKSNAYLFILKFRSESFIDHHFAMMPAMIYVTRDVFDKYCRS
jgi:SOS-response transcriptional repressor LexA